MWLLIQSAYGCDRSPIHMMLNYPSLRVYGHLCKASLGQDDFIKARRWTRQLKDWAHFFYQFALGVARIKVLSDL